MSERLFVKPAPGLTVRDPITLKPLPAEGAEVPADSYWLRRLKAGDVIEANPPAQEPPSAAPPASAARPAAPRKAKE
jgi:hypothetical protein